MAEYGLYGAMVRHSLPVGHGSHGTMSEVTRTTQGSRPSAALTSQSVPGSEVKSDEEKHPANAVPDFSTTNETLTTASL